MAGPDEVGRLLSAIAAELPELDLSELGGNRWMVAIPGTVRWRLPVLVEAGKRSWSATVFVLRGPWRGRGDAARLHLHLLRRNRGLRLSRFWLDRDDDVLLGVRLPNEGLSAGLLEAALAELLEVSEAAFEPLVHLGYPDVFPPLARPAG